ncbi:hypothetical protein GC197_10070 [bacterium]|nr:hypothetical protein [bacterium]
MSPFVVPFGVFEIDWQTGRLWQLGSEVIKTGMNLGVPLSPYGKRPILMKFGDEGPQPNWLDIESGKLTPIEVEAGLWSVPGW